MKQIDRLIINSPYEEPKESRSLNVPLRRAQGDVVFIPVMLSLSKHEHVLSLS